MEYNSALPIYLQVMTSVKHEIITGRLPLGSKLPSVRELAVRYKINPNTAGRVYRELESEGACFTRRGMGTFVTEDVDKVLQMKEETAQELAIRFLKGMQQLGFSKSEAVRLLEEQGDAPEGQLFTE